MFYNANPNDPNPAKSFEDALNPQTWRSHFHPFSFVFINPKGDWILIRDHLGIRPLFFTRLKNRLIFGDNLPDILASMPKAPAFNQTELKRVFKQAIPYTNKTLYKGIFRVEPGTLVYSLQDGKIRQKTFWALEKKGPTLQYTDSRDYLAHFSSLMLQSVQQATQGASSIAAEFSAGMDSSSIYGTCLKLGINPTLFLHAALPGSDNQKNYNETCERAFVQHFPQAVIHRIQAEDFDPLKVFKQYAAWFGMPSYYLFELFAQPVHQAVSQSGHTRLLSGFGGDQGISGYVPHRAFIPELLRNKKFSQAWQQSPAGRRRFFFLLKCVHPSLFKTLSRPSLHPFQRWSYKTLREAEWTFLQGPHNHEIRTRIECSSIVGKKLGFEYRYPLLHPELLEFYLSLPWEQKRFQGTGRWLMRRYLMQIMPEVPFENYQKRHGLNLMPAAMDMFKQKFYTGTHQEMIRWVQRYMLGCVAGSFPACARLLSKYAGKNA